MDSRTCFFDLFGECPRFALPSSRRRREERANAVHRFGEIDCRRTRGLEVVAYRLEILRDLGRGRVRRLRGKIGTYRESSEGGYGWCSADLPSSA